MTIFLLCILTILTLVVIIYLFFKGNKTPLLYSFISLQLMFFLLSACHLGALLFPESPNLVDNAVIAGFMLFFTIATFRYRFFYLGPITLRKIVDRMREAIVVVDGFNRIIDFNKRFVEFYGLNIRINEDFGSIFKLLKEKMEVSDTSQELLRAMKGEQYINAQGEICIRGLERKYFLVEIQLIPGRNHDNLGRIISFRDISEYKRFNQDLNRKNEELTAINDILLDANNKLQEHAATVEELAIVRERNRIARDVHDTLGHTLSLLATILQVTSISCKKDPDQTQKNPGRSYSGA